MSNHAGSHMLNEILQLLEREEAFAGLGKQKTRELVIAILKIADRYDCNWSKIMEGIASRVGVCRWCGKPADDFDPRLEECPACRSS